MLLIREAFKRATTVYVYILTEGKKAQAEITMSVPAESEEAGATTNTLTAAAKHGGSRGNAFTVTRWAAMMCLSTSTAERSQSTRG